MIVYFQSRLFTLATQCFQLIDTIRDPRTVWSADRSVRVGARFTDFFSPGAVRSDFQKNGPGVIRSLKFIFSGTAR